MKTAARIFGLLAGLLVLFLLVGILLPGTWEANADIFLRHPPEKVFPFLDTPEAWEEWAAIPAEGTEVYGPHRGVGSGVRWSDPQYGDGQMEISASVRDASVEYAVTVEGGSLLIQGAMVLEPEGDGTRVRWRESGDFGWNPLLGYTARGMKDSQGAALRASLERLGELLEKRNSGSQSE